MHLVTVSCALIAGLIASFIPAPMQGKLADEKIVVIQQDLGERAQAYTQAGGLQMAAADNDAEETGSIGNILTCEQIRIMDEVELITDDSYCGTERG